MHYLSPHTVTVPGAAAGWVDTVQKFGSGKVSLEQILTPAIELGEDGFPVSELCARLVSPVISMKMSGDLRRYHSGVNLKTSYETHHLISENSSNAIPRPNISLVPLGSGK